MEQKDADGMASTQQYDQGLHYLLRLICANT